VLYAALLSSVTGASAAIRIRYNTIMRPAARRDVDASIRDSVDERMVEEAT
jgi:hypothetical protein